MKKNNKTQDLGETKKNALVLYQEAKELIKGTYDSFKESAGGVLVPKHVPAAQPGLTIGQITKVAKELKQAAFKSDAEAKLVVEQAKQIKLSDYQQVPQHIAFDPDIWPGTGFAKPMDYKTIAAQIKDNKYIVDASGNAQLSDGMVLSKQLLSDPVFAQHLKVATVQLAVEQLEQEKQALLSPQHVPPGKWEVSESEKEIIKQLGMTEEQYLKWVNKEDEAPVATVSGAYTSLLQPGLAKAMEPVEDNLYANAPAPAPKKYPPLDSDKYLKYAEMYGQCRPLHREHSNEKVLSAIVAGILLSPRTFKMEGDSFVVPKDVLTDLDRTLRLRIEFSYEDQSYRVRLE